MIQAGGVQGKEDGVVIDNSNVKKLFLVHRNLRLPAARGKQQFASLTENLIFLTIWNRLIQMQCEDWTGRVAVHCRKPGSE